MNVVLVHGFLDRAWIMSRLARHLSRAGHRCIALSLRPCDGRTGIPALAEQLQEFIDERFPGEARFAMIGFSMGALVCRYYMQELGGHRRVEAFHSIAGPHRGTVMARFYPGRGAREMRPRSEFLKRLEETESKLAGIPTTSYWTPTDGFVIPVASAKMRGAEEVRISGSFHPVLTFSGRVCREIAGRLEKRPNKAPEPTPTSVMPRADERRIE